MTEPEKPKRRKGRKRLVPGLRIDGARRVNLSAIRAKKAALKAGKAPLRPTPTPEQAKARAQVRRKQDAAIQKRFAKYQSEDGGKDGMRVGVVQQPISGSRSRRVSMRCRPGSFEWSFGRKKRDNALFLAGSQLAILWEKAGMTVASSAAFLRGVSSGYKTGVSDGRLAAIDGLLGWKDYVGTAGAERMIAYCVEGKTSTELAMLAQVPPREMTAVLTSDLRATADILYSSRRERRQAAGGQRRRAA